MASPFKMPRGRRLRGRVTRFDNYALPETDRGIKRVRANLAGEPTSTPLVSGVTEYQGKRGIRRLMKVDPKVGLSMPEAKNITDTHVDVGGTGGYRGARVVAKSNDPQVANKGQTVVRTPRLGRLIRR